MAQRALVPSRARARLAGGRLSDQQTLTFGVRQVTSEFTEQGYASSCALTFYNMKLLFY